MHGRQHTTLPLGLQYKLMRKQKVNSLVNDFARGSVDDWLVTLLVQAESPDSELAAQCCILAAQQKPLEKRTLALDAAVAKCKVNTYTRHCM